MHAGRGRIAYRAPFETTEGIWQKIPIRFEDLTPTFRGRTRRDADPLDTSHIRGLSLLISDEQAGPFTLDVAWIEAA